MAEDPKLVDYYIYYSKSRGGEDTYGTREFPYNSFERAVAAVPKEMDGRRYILVDLDKEN